MKFDYLDESDERIADSAPRGIEYPARLSEVPENAGIFLFLDADDEVIYVGTAPHGKLASEIRSKWNTSTDLGARTCRWFRTNGCESASTLEAEWVRKYQPRNNPTGPSSESLSALLARPTPGSSSRDRT